MSGIVVLFLHCVFHSQAYILYTQEYKMVQAN